MRSKSSEKIGRIVEIIEYWKLKEGVEPTITQIAADAGMSRSCVHAYLTEMDEKGIISYSRRHYGTPKTETLREETSAAPVVGSAMCGDPILDRAEIVEYVRLPASIFGKSDVFILTARGDSMEDACISDEDLVVVENRRYAEKNEIVAALDEDGGITLKRFRGFGPDGETILAYENEALYPGMTLSIDRMRISGVVRFIIKKIGSGGGFVPVMGGDPAI